jgi:hypothetical protein
MVRKGNEMAVAKLAMRLTGRALDRWLMSTTRGCWVACATTASRTERSAEKKILMTGIVSLLHPLRLLATHTKTVRVGFACWFEVLTVLVICT